MTSPIRAAVRLAGFVVLAAAIAACGGAAPSSQPATETSNAATPTPSAAGSGAAESSPPSEATPPPEATPAESVAVPSLAADTPLVDLLPDEIGGEATQKVALVGSDLSALDPSAAMVFGSLLNVLGSPDGDMTIGLASNSRASVIAIRVVGKSALDVGEAMIVGRALNATTTREDLNLGGKPVVKVTTTTATVPFYVYGTGDVSFTVAGVDEAIVAEALSKLP
jgi:hypothetical protein